MKQVSLTRVNNCTLLLSFDHSISLHLHTPGFTYCTLPIMFPSHHPFLKSLTFSPSHPLSHTSHYSSSTPHTTPPPHLTMSLPHTITAPPPHLTSFPHTSHCPSPTPHIVPPPHLTPSLPYTSHCPSPTPHTNPPPL